VKIENKQIDEEKIKDAKNLFELDA